jgi:hypothetical protein
MKRKVLTAMCVTLAATVLAPQASARWAVGNGITDLEIADPTPPAQPGEVCTGHIEGRAGLSTQTEPTSTTPPPPGPYPPLTVQLFTGPDLVGAQGEPGGLRLLDPNDPNGTGALIPPIATVTTAPLTALSPPEAYDANGVATWEYAAAAFSFTLASGTIQPGDDVALREGNRTAVVILSAVACATTPPPPITAVIDILPGITPNFVAPSVRLPILPVRIFGSATLDVTKIATVKLGNASPVAIPPALAKLFVPKDRNGDGLLDRDYLFVPKATGIACGATSASLTGTLDGGGSFSGTDSVKTVCR